MANEKNLKPGKYKLTQEEAKKGGRNSVKSRRERKTIRELVNQILSENISEYPAIFQIAENLSIENCKNVKELMTLVTIINTVNTAKIDDLEKVIKILGEDAVSESNNGILDELTEYLKNE